jgi:hypothetical protein
VSLPRTTEVLFTLSLTFPVSKHCKVQFEGWTFQVLNTQQ